MARLGRGQPGAPIYLRAPLAVAAAALAPQMHIVQTQPERPVVATHALYLRGAPSVVPTRPASQITIISQAPQSRSSVARREPMVVVLRGGAAPPPAPALASPMHVTSQAIARALVPQARPTVVLYQTNGPEVAPRLAPQITVIGQAVARARAPVAHPTRVVWQRGMAVAPVPVARLAPQITVVGQAITRARASVSRPTIVLYQTNGPVVAPRLAPQFTIVQTRIRPPTTRVVVPRPPVVVVPAVPRLAPQITVVLQTQRQFTSGVFWRQFVVVLRGSPLAQPAPVVAPSVDTGGGSKAHPRVRRRHLEHRVLRDGTYVVESETVAEGRRAPEPEPTITGVEEAGTTSPAEVEAPAPRRPVPIGMPRAPEPAVAVAGAPEIDLEQITKAEQQAIARHNRQVLEAAWLYYFE